MKLNGNIVDVVNKQIFYGTLIIEGKRIVDIVKKGTNPKEKESFILPGLIDSHVHIESSMLIPQRFAELAVKNGTVAVVSDPHEIANVLGEEGVLFMIENSKKSYLKFYFGVPSCVPATNFETSGAVLDSKIVKKLLARNDLFFLAEMMNYPGVINEDSEVLKKIEFAKKLNKKIDGHAPGLRGDDLKKYIKFGIDTDHEAFSLEEAEEKIKLGMKIIIREGSAAKNFDELYPLIDKYPDKVMLCTDDSHPDDLLKGHINKIIKKGLSKNLNFFNILRAATLNPKLHYNLDTCLLRIGDPADFIIVDNLGNFNIIATFINGVKVYDYKQGSIDTEVQKKPINKFNIDFITIEDIRVKKDSEKIRVIIAQDKQLITDVSITNATVDDDFVVSDVKRDILKIVVINRYNRRANLGIGFIKGFGLKRGAIASTIAHDSHNIIAIGCSDNEIVNAVNKIIEMQGGIVVYDGDNNYLSLKLNYGGLMTDIDGALLSSKYKELKNFINKLGSKLNSPFMTLSFMALPVIPKLKITDFGLFDSEKFKKVDLFV